MAGANAAAADGDATQRFLAKYGVAKLAPQWGLSPQVCETLAAMNIASFFPVQAVAIPKVLDKSNDRVTDICINAPTGSGKTLVYVVPIVERLLPRVVCRVRALVVLPSRDLAIQVHAIVSRFCANTPLKCGLAIGQSNFAAEQATLVGKTASSGATDSLSKGSAGVLDGGQSLVDILVATPGRLVDHLEQTPGFTLQHLQFLVVDEADRLLNQSYQDWIAKIYASIFNGQDVDETEAFREASEPKSAMTRRRQDSINRRRIRTPLTRVLLSATLTRNPRKLASIGMSHAELTKIGRVDDPLADNAKVGDDAEEEDEDGDDEEEAAGESTVKDMNKDKEKMYATPTNLDEYVIECDTGAKPLVLLEILSDYKSSGLSIVFTSSVNSTHRLARLLQLHADHPERIREYSSSLTQKQRTALVADCKQRLVDVVVCSDAMARGMDIENVANVVNYDVPSFVKTYIHRVGRTARAGRHGRAVTLVKMGQMKGMRRMLQKAEKKELLPYALNEDHMKTLVPKYTHALQLLKETLEAEKDGSLSATAAVDKLRKQQGGGKLDVATSVKKGRHEKEEEENEELSKTERKRVLSMLYDQIEKNLEARQKQRTQ